MKDELLIVKLNIVFIEIAVFFTLRLHLECNIYHTGDLYKLDHPCLKHGNLYA